MKFVLLERHFCMERTRRSGRPQFIPLARREQFLFEGRRPGRLQEPALTNARLRQRVTGRLDADPPR